MAIEGHHQPGCTSKCEQLPASILQRPSGSCTHAAARFDVALLFVRSTTLSEQSQLRIRTNTPHLTTSSAVLMMGFVLPQSAGGVRQSRSGGPRRGTCLDWVVAEHAVACLPADNNATRRSKRGDWRLWRLVTLDKLYQATPVRIFCTTMLGISTPTW